MPTYEKYVCSTCKKAAYVDQSYFGIDRIPRCQNYGCKLEKMAFEKTVKTVAPKARLHTPKREPRSRLAHKAALSENRTDEALLAYLKEKEGKNFDAIAEDLKADDTEQKKKDAEDDEDDPAFLPESRGFKLEVRFTTHNYLPRHPITGITTNLTTGWKDIGESKKTGRDTAGVMGTYFKKFKKLPARTHSGRGKPYKTHRKESEEWCHLWGDALGGPMSADNLVAGSYCCNTYMAVIEKCLHAKAKVQIRVTAWCSASHVAEKIDYEMRSKADVSKAEKIEIDARAMGFNAADADTVTKRVTEFLTKHKLS